MLIHYVYIQNYEGVFKDAGFNLGGKYRFKYDPQSHRIEVTENSFYLKNFFKLDSVHEGQGNAEIENVCALIGENGAGKTSFLNFIKSNFVRGMGGISYPAIVALTSDNGEIKIYCDNNIPVDIQNSNLSKFSFHRIGPKAKKHQIPDLGIIHTSEKPEIEELRETDFIYLSNVFDNNIQHEFQGLFNISTDFLIRNDLKSRTEMIQEWGAKLNAGTEVEFHKFQDIHRQLEFINDQRATSGIPFNTPNRLNVSIGKDLLFSEEAEIGMQAESMLNAYQYKDFVISFKRYSVSVFENSNDPIERVIIFFTSNALLNFLFEIAIFSRYYRISFLNDYKFDRSKKYIVSFNELIKLLIEDLNRFENTFKKEGTEYEPYVRELDQLNSFLDFLAFLEQNVRKQNAGDKGNYFLIENQDSDNLLNKFFSIYKRTYRFDPYLNFAWQDLSSGEKAFLNIYSRLFSLSDKIISQKGANLILNKNVVILIDEGEAFLHPNWQRSFLTGLLEFAPVNFKSDKFTRKIQCIVTSNSPFLASDLPSTNVIFLKKHKDGSNIIQNSLEDQRQTFAANIHSLLSDAFFMSDGTIGEFAKRKINHVIELLQSKREEIESNQETIKNIINLIGEPIIKSKLTKMLSDRLSVDLIELGLRVKNLENEVKGLKKEK